MTEKSTFLITHVLTIIPILTRRDDTLIANITPNKIVRPLKSLLLIAKYHLFSFSLAKIHFLHCASLVLRLSGRIPKRKTSLSFYI